MSKLNWFLNGCVHNDGILRHSNVDDCHGDCYSIGQQSKYRKRIFIALLIWAAFMVTLLNYSNDKLKWNVRNMFVSRYLKYTPTAYDVHCKGYNDDPFDETIIKFFEIKPTQYCKNGIPSVMYIVRSHAQTPTDYSTKVSTAKNVSTLAIKPEVFTLTLDKKKIKRLGLKFDYCRYALLMRRNENSDFYMTMGNWSSFFIDSIGIPNYVHHLLGQCLRGMRIVSQDYLSIIRKTSDVEKTLHQNLLSHRVKEKTLENLSIMMIGIDGTSRNNFARQMSNTKTFLLENMGALELYRLNKVGLNTLPNVIPLLSGRSQAEILKNWTSKEYFDKNDHLFFWESARKAGYRTTMVLDKTNVTAFHYQKKGWKSPKFNFYNRPIVVHSESDKLSRWLNRYCIGDQSEITLLLDYFLQMAAVYNNSQNTPYFAYSFFAHLTHDDINLASTADIIYLDVLKKLKDRHLLNNTVLVFFSDHGSRFGPFRSTFKGMLEDNNPFMFFVFPQWFKDKYPELIKNFKINQHRMITNFDIHATLKDILYFHGDKMADNSDMLPNKDINLNNNKKKGIGNGDENNHNNDNNSNKEINNGKNNNNNESNTKDKSSIRGISLFRKIPFKRTCEEANIPFKYCNCRNFSDVKISGTLSKNISAALLREVIEKTIEFRDKCREVKLYKIVNVMSVLTPSQTEDFYQATIRTWPGEALYEGTLKKSKTDKDGINSVVSGDIQRVNMYRGQAECISDARLRPFCYCKNIKA